MKKIIGIFSVVTVAMLFLNACRKFQDLPYNGNGNAVTLTASKTSVAPTPADSNAAVIVFNWTSPKYATDSSTYKYIVEIDSSGRNFVKKTTMTVTGALNYSLTGRQLNNMLLNYGFTLGTPYKLDVRVISSYANNNEKYTSNTVPVTVTPFSDPSVFISSATTSTGTLATAAQNALTFSWTPSFKGYTGVVTYSIQYDSATKNFANAKEVAVGPTIYSKPFTKGEINQHALDVKVPGGNTGKVEYRLKATTALGAIAYSPLVAVTVQTYVPLLRFYMPGGYQAATGNGNNWDPATAPEFIRDLRPALLNKMYYMYIYLPAGTAFKVTQGRDWTIAYGAGATSGSISTTGGDINVATAGNYRISIDVANNKIDIREGRMGFVGDGVGANWNPSAVFPTYSMGLASKNLFVGLTDFSTNGWKLIDNNAWNSGSNTVDETRSYGATGGSGSTMEINGGNFPNMASAGRFRVIWDGRNPDDIKYEMSPATQMRVVGDGINMAGVNDWDPPSSPTMTYSGNGVWTISITLKANKDIKFLAGNAWGAFDYEDDGAGVGTGVRKIKWEGGSNFKTPATAGTYTITLNERTQTVSIN